MSRESVSQIVNVDRRRREIIQRADHIPPLPELVVRVLQLLGSPDTEPDDLADCLRNDPVLVGRMLALVNSPFYGISREVRSISDAIVVLGFRGLRSLILASSTSEHLERDYTAYGHGPRGLWYHSLAVAACARNLARWVGFGIEDRETLFVAGLLHDVGKMVLVPYFLQRGLELGEGPSHRVERELVGLDHAEAGALVAAKWNLSPLVQECIRQHHCDDVDVYQRELAVVRIADAFAHELGHGYVKPQPVAYDRADLELLELEHGRWDELKGELRQSVDVVIDSMARI